MAMVMMAFMVGCANKEVQEPIEPNEGISLDAILKDIKTELGEDYVANMPLEKEALAELISIDKDLIEEFIAEMPMMSNHVDTFIAIKAVDGKVDDVEKALEDYRVNLVENSMQYPMNIAKVNASQVIKKGDYVFFTMLGRYDDRQDITEAEALEFAENEIATINKIILNKFNQ